MNKQTDQWLAIDDADVRHVWSESDSTNFVRIPPTYYAESCTPVCCSGSANEGEDMVYVATEVSPRIANAIKFHETVEPVLRQIYDILYFDSDKGYFDPQKEWDDAAEFIETVAEHMIKLYGLPKKVVRNTLTFVPTYR